MSIMNAVGVVGEAAPPKVVYVTMADAGAASAAPLASAKGTCSTSGDNTLVAAPGAGLEIVPVSWAFWTNVAGPLTMTLGSDAVDVGYYTAQSAGQGITGAMVPGYPLGIGANAALELNLDSAKEAGYFVQYYVRAA